MYDKLILLFLSFVLLPSISGTDRGLNWYESLPAVAMDYKVLLEASKWNGYLKNIKNSFTKIFGNSLF